MEERFRSEEICLDIFTLQPAKITITASTPGWQHFLITLRENLPQVPANWMATIALPAFETNETLLYDRQNRSQAQVQQIYYARDTLQGLGNSRSEAHYHLMASCWRNKFCR